MAYYPKNGSSENEWAEEPLHPNHANVHPNYYEPPTNHANQPNHGHPPNHGNPPNFGNSANINYGYPSNHQHPQQHQHPPQQQYPSTHGHLSEYALHSPDLHAQFMQSPDLYAESPDIYAQSPDYTQSPSYGHASNHSNTPSKHPGHDRGHPNQYKNDSHNHNDKILPKNGNHAYKHEQPKRGTPHKTNKQRINKQQPDQQKSASNPEIPFDRLNLKKIHDKWYESCIPPDKPLPVNRRPKDDTDEDEKVVEEKKKRYSNPDYVTVRNLGIYLKNAIDGYDDCVNIKNKRGYAKFGCYSRTFIECVCIYFLKDQMEYESPHRRIEYLANNDPKMKELEFPADAMRYVRKKTNPIVHPVKYGVDAGTRFMEDEHKMEVMKKVADIAIWLEPIIKKEQGV